MLHIGIDLYTVIDNTIQRKELRHKYTEEELLDTLETENVNRKA